MNSIVVTTMLAVVTLVIVPVAYAAEPSAADRTTARELAQQGQEALWANDYATAVERFSRAFEIVHAPTVLLGLARAHAGLGHLVEANDAYTRVLREGLGPNPPKAFEKAYEDARKEVAAIAARMSWVVITVEGPSQPKVTIDGNALSPAAIGIRWAANPGMHEIRASGDGFVAAIHTVRLTEGHTTNVAMQLTRDVLSARAQAPTPVPAPGTNSLRSNDGLPKARRSSGARTASYIAFGVGGAALAAGAVTGVLALQEHGRLRDHCPNGVCENDEKSRYDRYMTLGLASTIGFGVGLAGAGAGLYLFLKGGTRTDAPQFDTPKSEIPTGSGVCVEPFLGFSVAGLRGSFQ